MFYLDAQRTVTRRDSSLIVQHQQQPPEEPLSGRPPSTGRLTSESAASIGVRSWGSVKREIVTLLFESMLDSIVDSWETIAKAEVTPAITTLAANSDVNVSTKKKKIAGMKASKTKRSRSKIDVDGDTQTDTIMVSWWSAPDEKAVIRFKNGNLYEGNISMKCMNGEGRYQWADGTVYLGNFEDNEIKGQGLLQWKDDTWYQGEFLGNIRHGKGLFVDSRKQRSYAGEWYGGTKHGKGIITYGLHNSYDGDWIYNVRHGYGSREYCRMSGYQGDWDWYIRDGKGVMIWPNHDLYNGEWKSGVMHGYGMYIWDAIQNNSMSIPSNIIYRGFWDKGDRNGLGNQTLGLGLGSNYTGEFKNNKKEGIGKFVTNDGLILESNNLFADDLVGPATEQEKEYDKTNAANANDEPLLFEICDDREGLGYHVEQVLKNIDRQDELRELVINEYLANNKPPGSSSSHTPNRSFDELPQLLSEDTLDDFVTLEETALRNALRCYETDLKNIYHKYATICNYKKIKFTPVLIRLYLWQFFYDCDLHHKGLTSVDIDNMLSENPQWLLGSPHGPFTKIYFWQFIHALITIASKLYAKRTLPGPKPDTILSNAFRTFMERDVLSASGKSHGKLSQEFGHFIPLTGLYELYCKLGEPHTIRKFIRNVRRPSHYWDQPQPVIVDEEDNRLPYGYNAYVVGDKFTFVTENTPNPPPEYKEQDERSNLLLFNFGNLSTKTIINIFGRIFSNVSKHGILMSLDIEMTFYEFFEAFVECAEESIRVKDEEIRWREKFKTQSEHQVQNSPVGRLTQIGHSRTAAVSPSRITRS